MQTRCGLLEMMADVMRTHEEQERAAIAEYCVVASETHGEQLEWDFAASLWWRDHFSNWKRVRWFEAIEEALQFDYGFAPAAIAG